jgi:hypothetical protein
MEPAAWPYPKANEAAASAPTSQQTQAAEEEDAREQVRRAVAQMRSELHQAPEAPRVADVAAESASHSEPLAATAEMVQLPTAEAVTEASATESSPATAPADDEDLREQVRRTVEQLKGGVDQLANAPADEPFDVREQVRRAVEEAKAEMESGGVQELQAHAIADAFDPEKLRIPHYEAVLDERFLQPAILVIDDPEGRVELVRVYRTLARLEVAATANLANYSSHSVTVQLEERKVPSEQDINDAINYAFERDCTVDIDGNRASIRLFGGKTRAA